MKKTLGAPVGIVALTLLLKACAPPNTPALSVDEARRVQAQFQDQAGFLPPPRTIADITAVLDQHRPDPARLGEARRRAAATPAPDLAPGEQAEFLHRRAQAAGEYGNLTQQLADAQEAVRLGRASGHPQLNRFLQQLERAASEQGFARLRTELTRQRQASAVTQGQRIASLAAHAQALAQSGAMEDAADHLARAETLLAVTSGDRSPALAAARPTFEATLAAVKAELAEANGRYRDAEAHLRFSQEQWSRAKASPGAGEVLQQAMVVENLIEQSVIRNQADLARVLVADGRLIEAEIEARRGLIEALRSTGRYSTAAALATLGLAEVVHEQGRYAEAAALADVAIDAFRQLGAGKGSAHLARSLTLRGRILDATDDGQGALASFEEARDVLADDPALGIRLVDNDPTYGAALLRADRTDAAITAFAAMSQRLREQLGPRHYRSAEASGYLGAALVAAGRLDAARDAFRQAVPILMQTSRQASEDAGLADRDRRLRRIMEAYLDLLSRGEQGSSPASDATAESFRVAEAIRARGVQRALTASATRAGIRDPRLASLARQEQDAQKQVSALYGVLSSLLAAPADQQDPAAIAKLRTDIDRLRDARAALRSEIERSFPDYADLIDPRPAAIADAKALLRPREALLSIYVGEARSYVWAVPGGPGAPVFLSIDVGAASVAAMVSALRHALDPRAATLGDIPPFDLATAHALYRHFVQPVRPALAGADTLLVIADRTLGQIPFGLLVTRPTPAAKDDGGALFSGYAPIPYMIRDHAIAQVPGVASLAALRRIQAGGAARRAFVGFGDPVFNQAQLAAAAGDHASAAQPAAAVHHSSRGLPLRRRSAPLARAVDSADLATLSQLPDTALEVRAVAAALGADPAADAVLGRAATEEAVKAMTLSDRKVVMFATHGLVPGDLNGLTQPALALSSPALTQSRGDGLLTMGEILALRLDADWVVLSACNTGAGDGAGAEAASGLGRAFFYAGTRAVLVTNWPVETTSARTLVTDIFLRQAADPTLNRGEALRQAMLAMIDHGTHVQNGRTVFAYAHPIFWAPYTLIGDAQTVAGR